MDVEDLNEDAFNSSFSNPPPSKKTFNLIFSVLQYQIDRIDHQIADDRSQTGTFLIGPLERGQATTLGNSLRRVLMGGLEGSAVTAVRIAGINTYKSQENNGLSSLSYIRNINISFGSDDNSRNYRLL